MIANAAAAVWVWRLSDLLLVMLALAVVSCVCRPEAKSTRAGKVCLDLLDFVFELNRSLGQALLHAPDLAVQAVELQHDIGL